VALMEVDGERTIVAAERRTPVGERTARSLLPTMQGILREHDWRPADVGLVCVTSGPGSFTGLRIGVVAAKTFAYATGAKLAEVNTLAAMAAGVNHRGPGKVWAVLDAQRQELFVASFNAGQPMDESVAETEVLSIADWIGRLSPGDVVAGPPLAKLRQQLLIGVVVVDESVWEPMALPVARLGLAMFQRNGGVDPLELVPRYYRKSAAEEKASRDAGAGRGV
jgi:tRNA threonylcarbamoyladenosine biosynthesis protein TsaB